MGRHGCGLEASRGLRDSMCSMAWPRTCCACRPEPQKLRGRARKAKQFRPTSWHDPCTYNERLRGTRLQGG